MIKKIVTALLSTVFFSFAIVTFVVVSQDVSNITLVGLGVYMYFYGIYSLPVYLIAGIPISIFIEKMTNQKLFKSNITRYIIKFALYSLAGMVAAFVYMMILLMEGNQLYLIGDTLVKYLVYGIIASLIYYHVLIVVDGKKESKNNLSKFIS